MPAMSKLAPVLAVALVAVVIVVAFMADDSGKTPMPAAGIAGGVPGAVPAQAQNEAMRPAQSPIPQGQGNGGAGAGAAPMLEGLVGGLEAKVKADPTNINNRLLLAQTYAELGRFDDSVKMLREMQTTNGDDSRVKLVAAMVLGKSENPEHLNEALKLLGDVEAKEPGQKGQAILHKGRVLKKMGNPDQAKSTWQEGMAQLPESDPLRKEIEKELANI